MSGQRLGPASRFIASGLVQAPGRVPVHVRPRSMKVLFGVGDGVPVPSRYRAAKVESVKPTRSGVAAR